MYLRVCKGNKIEAGTLIWKVYDGRRKEHAARFPRLCARYAS